MSDSEMPVVIQTPEFIAYVMKNAGQDLVEQAINQAMELAEMLLGDPPQGLPLRHQPHRDCPQGRDHHAEQCVRQRHPLGTDPYPGSGTRSHLSHTATATPRRRHLTAPFGFYC